MTVWHANFSGAHQDKWQRNGGYRIDGLTWDDRQDAFTKDYRRPVSLGFGPLAYTYQEHTRVEVRPKYCEGPLNKVASATANGESLGIGGMHTYAGQVVSAPPGSKISFADGAVMELDKGGSFEVDKLAPRARPSSRSAGPCGRPRSKSRRRSAAAMPSSTSAPTARSPESAAPSTSSATTSRGS